MKILEITATLPPLEKETWGLHAITTSSLDYIHHLHPSNINRLIQYPGFRKKERKMFVCGMLSYFLIRQYSLLYYIILPLLPLTSSTFSGSPGESERARYRREREREERVLNEKSSSSLRSRSKTWYLHLRRSRDTSLFKASGLLLFLLEPSPSTKNLSPYFGSFPFLPFFPCLLLCFLGPQYPCDEPEAHHHNYVAFPRWLSFPFVLVFLQSTPEDPAILATCVVQRKTVVTTTECLIAFAFPI